MSKSRETTKYSSLTLGCLVLLLASIVCYLYFLNMSVVQVVMRTEFTKQQTDLSAEIALLESAYIEAQHTVATRIASLEGYNFDSPKVFVSSEQASLVLGSE